MSIEPGIESKQHVMSPSGSNSFRIVPTREKDGQKMVNKSQKKKTHQIVDPRLEQFDPFYWNHNLDTVYLIVIIVSYPQDLCVLSEYVYKNMEWMD